MLAFLRGPSHLVAISFLPSLQVLPRRTPTEAPLMINSSYSSGLASYMNSSTSTTDLFSTLAQRAGLQGSKTSRGKTTTLSIDTVNKMTNPEQKIIYAGQVAQNLQTQADISLKSLNPTRIKDITAQAKKIMATINDAVTQLKAKDTKAKEGQVNAGVKTCQDQISTAMSTLHTILSDVAKLCDKASADTATTVKQSLKGMETTAVSIAKLSGTSWKSLFKGGTSVTSTASSKSSLVDILA